MTTLVLQDLLASFECGFFTFFKIILILALFWMVLCQDSKLSQDYTRNLKFGIEVD